jgi:hypothetical protein
MLPGRLRPHASIGRGEGWSASPRRSTDGAVHFLEEFAGPAHPPFAQREQHRQADLNQQVRSQGGCFRANLERPERPERP